MEGRKHSGVLFVLSGCKDPSMEKEWNDWYEKVHAPEIARPGVYSTWTRWENVKPVLKPGEAKYMAVYETERSDMQAGQAEQSKALSTLAPEKLKNGLTLVTVFGTYKQISKYGEAKGKKTTGALAVLCNCKDPAQEEDFNKWYDEVHLVDIMKTGCYFTANRYVATEAKPGLPKYLALYETDWEDVVKARQEMTARAGKMVISKALEAVLVGAFKKR